MSAQDQAPLTKTNASYEEDKCNEIGQSTMTQQVTLAGDEMIPNDEGIGNDQGKYMKKGKKILCYIA
ncbi:unnamed protein product [Adineta steineri]|uniref:Uncharacterized protein n=1 Tax=Adineta steineri TaxID=433720 RepID=A0A814L6T8_9BILA|nr:unnamed protein product [Adineta steineri]CAF4220108.1 unnamed protein product [Adineta steineri]